MKSEQLDKECSALVGKVNSATSSYADGKLTHMELLKWLVEYGNRANDLLHPRSDTPEGQGEWDGQAYRHLRQYNNHTALIDFCAKHNLTLPKNEIWWYIRDQTEGHVKGIYTEEGKDVIRGVMRITNGLIAWVEKRDGTLVQVHNEWWQKDRKDSKVNYCIHCSKPIFKVEDLDCKLSWVDEIGETLCASNPEDSGQGSGLHETKVGDKKKVVKVETIREKLLKEMFL